MDKVSYVDNLVKYIIFIIYIFNLFTNILDWFLPSSLRGVMSLSALYRLVFLGTVCAAHAYDYPKWNARSPCWRVGTDQSGENY